MAILKTLVTFGGVPLGGVQSIVWAFTTGTAPFRSAFSVRKADWPKIQAMIGKPQDLVISDRSRKIRIQKLYALHQLPSDSPARVTFEVADKRHWWQYPIISRDYNMAKKTGNRIFLTPASSIKVPSVKSISDDQYDYRQYSLKDGQSRWTAQDAVRDLLEQLEGEAGGHRIDSFPITDGGQFALQNVMLHDSADVALGRLLSFIPGTQIYVDVSGTAVVFDGADLDATERHKESLPVSTYAGDFPALIDRKAIRPSTIKVHYQREVELAVEYEDDYTGQTSAGLNKNDPFVQNVIPTTDPETEVSYFDPIAGEFVNGPVPAGTWVPVFEWLQAMNDLKGAESEPWTFKTIRENWIIGNLEGALGARPNVDQDLLGSISARVEALKANFRQTFQINRRYMERIQDITAIRANVLNPHTGHQGPSRAWGQICIVPSLKGEKINQRFDPDRTGYFTNLDTIPGNGTNNDNLTENPALPLNVEMVDRDLGIFHISFQSSPYGTDAGWYPCHLEFETKIGNQVPPKTHGRDLSKMDTEPVTAGAKLEGSTNGQFLAEKMEMRFILSIIPGAPNNKTRYHVETVSAADIQPLYRSQYRIQSGQGPALEVFISPGEQAARFAWQVDTPAKATMKRLLGLDSENPNSAGIPSGEPLDGFLLVNDGDQKGGRHLKGHALAVAAEVISAYADALQGSVKTRLPAQNVSLVGNMSAAAIEVASYPDAEVSVTHEFPGQQAPISRMATMPEMVRQFVLGIIPFRKADK